MEDFSSKIPFLSIFCCEGWHAVAEIHWRCHAERKHETTFVNMHVMWDLQCWDCSKKSMSRSVYCVSFSPGSDVLDAVLFQCFPTGSSRDEKKGCFPAIAWLLTPSCQQRELVIIWSDWEVQQPNPVQRPLAQKPFELHVFRPAHTNWSCVGVSASSC